MKLTIESDFATEGIGFLDGKKEFYVKRSQEALKTIARMTVDEERQNILKGRSYMGGSVPANLKGTRVLTRTFRLANSPTYRIDNPNEATVFLNESSYKNGASLNRIAGYLQRGTDRMPARTFWGWSSIIDTKADNILKVAFN